MPYLIATYDIAPDETQEGFERWLREVDWPGYARLTSMRNPVYLRAAGLLGERGALPFRYCVVIEINSADAVEAEMAKPEWSDFIADFEGRTSNAAFVVAERLAMGQHR